MNFYYLLNIHFQYVNTIIRQALDTYKNKQIEHLEKSNELEVLVNRIFQQNLDLKDYSLVIGLSLDARRLDMLNRAIEAAINESGGHTAILIETLNKLFGSQLDIEFQDKVLDLVYKFLKAQKEPNYYAVSQVNCIKHFLFMYHFSV